MNDNEPTLQCVAQHPMDNPRIVVLVSGTGSNMRDLAQAIDDGRVPGQIVAVGADRSCAGIDWAGEQGLPTFVHPYRKMMDRDAWDEKLTDLIAQYEPDLIVCAGFLKLLGSAMLKRFGGRILNTHNSLLPAFPGIHGPADAVAAGVKLAGATLFIVDEGVDTGVIMAQTAVPVLFDDDADSLLDRIKEAERAQLVETVGAMLTHGWTICGRRSRIGVDTK